MRELRIAPVMTGGTSLAVWMGGATAELHRMVRSAGGDPGSPDGETADAGIALYRDLLELTLTTPVVDVITGTSAGGLNGTLLAAATVFGISADQFMSIRETWLGVADLERLLRKGAEPDPPSLLLGDEYFLVQVRAKLDEWQRAADVDEQVAERVDVVATVTAVTPVPTSRTDHFGEPINEVDHAHWLRFKGSDHADPDWVAKLATAARTSASIPGVFEPSFLPTDDAGATASGRPNFEGSASFVSSRWAVDGGTVVNLPLTEAVERIFDQRADGDVRRVVAYVSPTPGAGVPDRSDDPNEPPTLLQSLTTVISGPRAEGVSADIDLLEQQNADVERQVRARQLLAPHAAALLGTGSQLFALYQERRSTESVHAMLSSLRRATSGRLPVDETRLETLFLAARAAVLPTDLDELDADEGRWGWGIRPVEEAVSIALSLIGRSSALTDQATSSVDRDALRTARRAVHGAREEVRLLRAADSAYWTARFKGFPATRPAPGGDPDAERKISAWAAASYDAWPGTERPPVLTRLRRAHRAVAGALRAAGPAMNRIAASAGQDDVTAGVQTELEHLGVAGDGSTSVVGSTGDVEGTPEEARVLDENVQLVLLRLHVLQTVVLGDVQSREQCVELLQISFNSWNAFDPHRAPADKLAGPELARLGAFLKPSWRANDWFWGRMDAAYRLVLLLLDPRRLRQLQVRPDDVLARFPALAGAADSAVIAQELECLQTGATYVPRSLPATACVLAALAQTAIAQDELPRVAHAVTLSSRAGSDESAGEQFRQAVEAAPKVGRLVAAHEVGPLVRQMRIGQETAGTQLGSRLMNRVATRGAAVAVNLLTGRSSGIPVLPRLLRPLRAPLQGLASVVGIITGESPLARGLAAFVLAAAGAIVSLRVVGIDVPAGTFTLSALLLTGLVVVAMLRSGFVWLTLSFAAAAAVVALTLAGAELATVVWSGDTARAEVELEDGAVVVVDGGAVVRITDGEGIVTDLELADGAALTLEDGDASLAARPPQPEQASGWKRWGFVNEVSVARLLLTSAAVVLAVGLRRRWRRSTDLARAGRGALVGVLTAAVFAAPALFEAILTGTPPAESEPRDLKAKLVDLAEALHGYQLEVVLLLFVGTSVLLGLGADIAASRLGRRLRRRVRRAQTPAPPHLETLASQRPS